MNWSDEAKQAISRVPFFVRKMVKKRVEQEAAEAGARTVEMAHVDASKKRFMDRMEDEVKGYRVETCFGSGGCPNAAVDAGDLVDNIEKALSEAELRSFLKEKVDGPLKIHHDFRVSVSNCPNACSRPQIADIGIIGAKTPAVDPEKECSRCEGCVEACPDGAVSLDVDGPVIDEEKCLRCGKCITVCPTGTLTEGETGYRIQIGGKLGRRPRLADELEGIHTEQETLDVIERCVRHYKKHCKKGERFGEILERTGKEGIR